MKTEIEHIIKPARNCPPATASRVVAWLFSIAVTALSFPAQAVVLTDFDFELPGLRSSSWPNFANDVNVTWRKNGNSGSAMLTASKIVGSDTYLNFSDDYSTLTESFLISHGTFRLNARFGIDSSGEYFLQGGKVIITGGINTDLVSGNGVLMTATLSDFAFDDDLIGFNTTDIVCPLFDFCTTNESVYLSLGAGVFSTDLERYASTGLAVTTVGSAVSTIPVPPSVWLFGSGLLGLVGIARRRKH